ncbi:MAG TPA: hypothetical protein VIU87_13185 [Mycobacterium sp.]
MAARFDIAARLMEGFEAVDELQVYVEACRLRGYQHADLTMRGNQIRDWYTAEEGLDLRVLDADCATLRGVAGDAGEALRSARSQAVVLADSWMGQGGELAAEFVRRHCNTAEMLVDALQAAADACAVLRDELWRVVDRRVAQTQEIVDRVRAQRPVWLAAARTVSAGGPAHDDAVQTVDGQVKPFVDNAVGVEWVSAMRLADGEVAAAYRVVIDVADAAARLRFEVPGDLGPRYSVPRDALPAAAPTVPDAMPARTQVLPEEGAADVVVPAAPPVAAPSVAAPPVATPPVAAPPLPNPFDALASVPAASPADGLPGFGAAGMPDLGGTHSMPGRLADVLSGLADRPALPEVDTPDELELPNEPDEPDADEEAVEPDEPDPDEPDADEPEPGQPDPDDTEADDTEADDAEADDAEAGNTEAGNEEDGEGDPPAAPPEPDCPGPLPEEPAPTPVPESAPVADPPPPAPADAAGMPCEIAAEELPQAGQ